MAKTKIKKPRMILGVKSDLIERYIKFVEENDIPELTIKISGTTFTIKRGEPKEIGLEKSILKSETEEKQIKLNFDKKETKAEEKVEKSDKEISPSTDESKYHKIVAPLPGVFYRTPSPTSPPFVKENDKVSVGQTLCIIEAMKIMNKITSDINGTIVKILVENGKPVKQNDVLFLIEPA